MKDNEWHSGPPPSCGWWQASMVKDTKILRWWDGKAWSCHASYKNNSKEAAISARYLEPHKFQSFIKWQNRPKSWPARSFT